MRRVSSSLLALLGPLAPAPACTGAPSEEERDRPRAGGGTDDTAGTSPGDTHDDATDTGEGGLSPDAPVVGAADAWCYLHDVGDPAWLWRLTATADDPQGAETIEQFTLDGISVWSEGALVAAYAITCTSGACSSSWTEVQDGVTCSDATSWTIRVEVVDEDGNRSKGFEVQGRQGTDANG